MADSIPWFKAIQSVGRGFRPGIEVQVMSAGTKTGKSITVAVDIESDDFKPWRLTFLTHYAEYRDFDAGETYWKKFKRVPTRVDMMYADRVIRKNEDGTYEYIKNRGTSDLRQLTEEEAVWLILKAG
jgi:DNA topoisomerase VI subunit B